MARRIIDVPKPNEYSKPRIEFDHMTLPSGKIVSYTTDNSDNLIHDVTYSTSTGRRWMHEAVPEEEMPSVRSYLREHLPEIWKERPIFFKKDH